MTIIELRAWATRHNYEADGEDMYYVPRGKGNHRVRFTFVRFDAIPDILLAIEVLDAEDKWKETHRNDLRCLSLSSDDVLLCTNAVNYVGSQGRPFPIESWKGNI